MKTQCLDEKFVIGPQSEPKKIESILPLNSARLLDILTELNSNKHTQIHLREKGFEVYGEFSWDDGQFCTDRPIGAIVSGSHFGKPSSCLYLATFDYTEGENKELIPEFNLTEILKDYIIIA